MAAYDENHEQDENFAVNPGAPQISKIFKLHMGS